jgi:hypothetical protein
MAKGIGGKCSCCTSPHRREIDLALVAGVGIDVIAKRFDVSRDSVWRHGKRHLSAVQRAALATALKPSAIDLEQLQRHAHPASRFWFPPDTQQTLSESGGCCGIVSWLAGISLRLPSIGWNRRLALRRRTPMRKALPPGQRRRPWQSAQRGAVG